MEKRIFITSSVLTVISTIIDFSYVFVNYDFDIGIVLTIVVIIFNKCLMLGSIYFAFALLMKEYREDGQNDKKLRIWLVISGVVFVALSVILHIELIDSGVYIVENGFAWLGSAFSSIVITAIAGRAAYDRKSKKK